MSGDKRSLTDRMLDRSMGINERIDEWTGSDLAGDLVGGAHLAGQTLLSPAIAAGEVIGDGARGLRNKAQDFGGWVGRGIRGIYGF